MIDNGVHHNARRVLDLADHPFHLPRRADQRIDVFDRQHRVEARADRLGHGVKGLARGVGNEVDVKIGAEALGCGHERAPFFRN